MDIEMLRISDIDVASTLYTLGIPITGVFASGKKNRFNEPVVECYFEKNPEVVKLVDDYYMDALRVNPKTLLANRKEIITRMKNAQNT